MHGNGSTQHVHVAIVGTGFSGLGMAMGMKRAGRDDFLVFERAGAVGGTWRDNTYPGCQCDVPSHLYSFSFATTPDWSRTYSPQAEIRAYLQRCADDFGVMPHVRFNHEVLDACWDDDRRQWVIETSGGRYRADLLVLANGALAEPSIPDVPGLDGFDGAVFHSAVWRHDCDLSGKRVAVVGTGASAVQIVPEIQPQVERLYVFQRTPAWVLPHTDRPIRSWEKRVYRRLPVAQRLVRAFIYWLRELLVVGMAKRPRFLRPIERLGRLHLRRQVRDPALRRQLTPSFTPGCKRLLLSDDFYPALQADNVELVASGVREVRGSAVVGDDGTEREVDAVVFATGFRVTDNPVMRQVRRADGPSLGEVFEADGARAYLGTAVPGFPNLFLMTGPNTGIGHTSLVVMIEAQMRYLLDALRVIDERDLVRVEVRRDAFEAFNDELQAKMPPTVWTGGGCASWYLDEHGRNTTMWPDFTWRFRRRTRAFDAEAYDVLARPAAPTAAAEPTTAEATPA